MTSPVLSAFGLLANPHHVAILELLWRRPASVSELSVGICSASRSAIYDDVRRLELAGVVVDAEMERPRRWRLTEAGRQLRSLLRLTERVAQRLRTRSEASSPEQWRSALLTQLADPRVLLLVRALLLEGPAHAAELERRLRGEVTHRGLYERLPALVQTSVLSRAQTGRLRRYALRPEWGRLAGPLLLGARWEWQWGTPAHPALASDLGALLALIAPAVRAPRTLRFECLFVVDAPHIAEPVVRVELTDGTAHVSAHAGDVGRWAGARAAGTPAAWCEAMVAASPSALDVEGRSEHIEHALKSLSRALLNL